MTLYRPSDCEAAAEQWGANCGPAALAAVLGKQCEQVRDLVCDPGRNAEPCAFKGYMGVVDMTTALARALVERHAFVVKPPKHLLVEPGARRIVLVQWNGSWDAVPKAAASRRHWIGNAVVDGRALVYDVNEDGWVPLEGWVMSTVPQLLPKRATGWSLAWAAEVS